jgi:beta-catenin-like protein 1
MELHFQYFERVQAANNKIESDEEDEDEIYLRRLDAGLFTLQLIDYIIIEIASSTASIPSIRQRVMQILNLRNSSIDAIKAIVRGKKNEYMYIFLGSFFLFIYFIFRICKQFGKYKENKWC